MVERGGNPGGSRVASLALLRKTSLSVIWVCGAVVIVGMAAVAIRGRASKLSVEMAGGAGQRGMRAGEGETGKFKVVELGVKPGVHAVAGFAGRGKIQRLVVGIEGLLKVGVMAGNAAGWQSHELADGFAFVAINAIQHGMGAEEREAIGVIFYLLPKRLPAFDRVALRAIGAELAAVNVGVAIRALRSNIGKH